VAEEQVLNNKVVQKKLFFGLKYLKFFDADPDPRSGIFLTRDPGWKNPGSGINIPGSATLVRDRLRKRAICHTLNIFSPSYNLII
jgi:hypothetical protein